MTLPLVPGSTVAQVMADLWVGHRSLTFGSDGWEQTLADASVLIEYLVERTDLTVFVRCPHLYDKLELRGLLMLAETGALSISGVVDIYRVASNTRSDRSVSVSAESPLARPWFAAGAEPDEAVLLVLHRGDLGDAGAVHVGYASRVVHLSTVPSAVLRCESPDPDLALGDIPLDVALAAQ